MVTFAVSGPHDIPFKRKLKGAKFVNKDELKPWINGLEGNRRPGCYVLGVMTTHGKIRPVYVGKATGTLASRLTPAHVGGVLNEPLNEGKKGRPYLFLVYQEKGLNRSAINDAETHLIALAAEENPKLLNRQKLPKEQKWRIKGAVFPEKGEKKSSAAKAFKRTLGIK